MIFETILAPHRTHFQNPSQWSFCCGAPWGTWRRTSGRQEEGPCPQHWLSGSPGLEQDDSLQTVDEKKNTRQKLVNSNILPFQNIQYSLFHIFFIGFWYVKSWWFEKETLKSLVIVNMGDVFLTLTFNRYLKSKINKRKSVAFIA